MLTLNLASVFGGYKLKHPVNPGIFRVNSMVSESLASFDVDPRDTHNERVVLTPLRNDKDSQKSSIFPMIYFESKTSHSQFMCILCT